MYWKVGSHSEGNTLLFTPAWCEKHRPRYSLLSTTPPRPNHKTQVGIYNILFPAENEDLSLISLQTSVSSLLCLFFLLLPWKRCAWGQRTFHTTFAAAESEAEDSVSSFSETSNELKKNGTSLKKEPDATKIMKVRLLERLTTFFFFFPLPLHISRLSFCHILGFFQKSTMKAVEPSANFWAPPTVWLNLRKTVCGLKPTQIFHSHAHTCTVLRNPLMQLL